MSFKGEVEDKSAEAPLPRSLTSLRGLIVEVQGMIRSRRLGPLPGLLEELQTQRRRCNAEQIALGQTGGPAELFVQYADALNQSMEVQAEGMALVDPNSVVRFNS
jgi:hypothetical protein